MTVRVRMTPLHMNVVRFLANLLILAGVAGVLVWIGALTEGALYQNIQGERFATETGAGSGTAEVEAAADFRLPSFSLPKVDPRLLGRLEIPSIGLSVMVREGVDSATLRKAVGHLPSSAGPGEPGNFVLMAHRDTFFRPLRDITRGDAIHIRTGQGDFTYVVDSITVISPDFLPVSSPSSEPISTLITCFPFTFTGPAPRRFVVQARMAESVHIE